MNKKLLIALADAIREHNARCQPTSLIKPFNEFHLETLADFCRASNPAFKRDRWLGYIAGENGKNGGSIR